jgi:hypothetical protein
MAYRKHRSSKRSRRNAMRKTLTKGVSMVETTSKKYIPKVKSGLEKVGSKVTTSAEKSVPMLQQASRKFLSIFGIGKTKKHRRH